MINILESRIHAGLTQKKCAQQLHISQPYLCQIEAGKKRPSIDLICKMSPLLNISLKALITHYAKKDEADAYEN